MLPKKYFYKNPDVIRNHTVSEKPNLTKKTFYCNRKDSLNKQENIVQSNSNFLKEPSNPNKLSALFELPGRFFSSTP